MGNYVCAISGAPKCARRILSPDPILRDRGIRRILRAADPAESKILLRAKVSVQLGANQRKITGKPKGLQDCNSCGGTHGWSENRKSTVIELCKILAFSGNDIGCGILENKWLIH